MSGLFKTLEEVLELAHKTEESIKQSYSQINKVVNGIYFYKFMEELGFKRYSKDVYGKISNYKSRSIVDYISIEYSFDSKEFNYILSYAYLNDIHNKHEIIKIPVKEFTNQFIAIGLLKYYGVLDMFATYDLSGRFK